MPFADEGMCSRLVEANRANSRCGLLTVISYGLIVKANHLIILII